MIQVVEVFATVCMLVFTNPGHLRPPIYEHKCRDVLVNYTTDINIETADDCKYYTLRGIWNGDYKSNEFLSGGRCRAVSRGQQVS